MLDQRAHLLQAAIGFAGLPLIHLGLVLVAQATPVSVSEVLTNPDRFHGQSVTVSGRMDDLRESVTRRGTRYYTFKLSDSTQTVYVRSFERPPCRSGAATVEGTFEDVKRQVKVSYSFNEIIARKVICGPDTEDPSKAKGK